MATGRSFFDLPIELRNTVYGGLSRPVATVPVPNPPRPGTQQRKQIWKASLDSYMIPTLLLVNKVFKTEYEQEICRKAKLCMRHDVWQVHGKVPESKRTLLPGNLLVNICHVELVVTLRDWRLSTQPLLREQYVLLRGCNLPNLKTLEIQLTVNREQAEGWFVEEKPLRDIGHFFALVKTFPTTCTQMYKRAELDIGVYVKERLFTPYLHHLIDDEVDRETLDDWLYYDLGKFAEHETVWKASLSEASDPNAFCGMNLDFVSGGHFDVERYDRLLQENLDMLESEAEESADEPGNLRDLVLDVDEGLSSDGQY